eukprot:RCo051807
MVKSHVTFLEPLPRESSLRRLVSIRVFSLAFFVMALALTTLAVGAVLVSYSTSALTGLKDASSDAMLDISTRTDAITASTVERAGTAVVRAVELSANYMMNASVTSQEQVMTMSSELQSRGLAQFVNSLEDFLGSMQGSVEAAYRLITTVGIDLNNLDDVLSLAPYAFATLPYDRINSLAVLGAVSGVLAVYFVSQGYAPQALIVPQAGDSISAYTVNTSTGQVIYPSSKCFGGFVPYCNLSTGSLLSPVFGFTSTIEAGQLRFGPLLSIVGVVTFKYVILATSVRSPNGTFLGAVARTADFKTLSLFLQNLVSRQPTMRMYLVDGSGTLLAASDIDPEEDLPYRPYENVLTYPEAIVNQSAKFLLQKYGSWANLSFGRMDAVNLTNLT